MDGPRRGGGGYLAVLVAGDGNGVGADLGGVAPGLAVVIRKRAQLVVEGVQGDLELGGHADEGCACVAHRRARFPRHARREQGEKRESGW